jgi:hypothetical protein
MTPKFTNNKHFKLALVGVATVLVLVVGALAINLITSQRDQAQASIQAQEEFLAETEQYVNEEADYAIRYYNDWFITERSQDMGIYMDFQGSGDKYVENVQVDFITNASADKYISTLPVESMETVDIAGTTADKVTYTKPFGSVDLQVVAYIFAKDGNLYVVAYTGEIGGDYDKFFDPARQMIESFEF